MPTPVITQQRASQTSTSVSVSNTPTTPARIDASETSALSKTDRADVRHTFGSSVALTTDYILRGVHDFFGKQPDEMRSAQANMSPDTFLNVANDAVSMIDYMNPTVLNALLGVAKDQLTLNQPAMRSAQANLSAYDYVGMVVS
jgi:hypothetical protein